MVALFKGITASTEDEKAIPAKFTCSLSGQLMKNPVRIAGSKFPVAYEESALEAYFEEHGYTDPKTNIDLGKDGKTILDLALQRKIKEFLEANPTLAEANHESEARIHKPF